MSVGPTCKIKNHIPYYICMLLQRTSIGWALDHKSYLSDDIYLSHHDIAGHGVNNASVNMHVSPVTFNNRTTCSQDVSFDERSYE